MKKDLLELNRLPTLDELKEFFKENDWTAAKIDDPTQRTDGNVPKLPMRQN